MPAAAPLAGGTSMDYPVASCSAPVSVATLSFEAQIAKPAASRRPPMGGEAIERRPAPLTSGDCAPDSATSTFNSRLPKNVIAGRLRQGQFLKCSCQVSAQLCQERVRPLFFPLAPSRERRLNGFGREVWRLSTWRRKYLHRGWPGKSRRSHEIKTEAATGDGRP